MSFTYQFAEWKGEVEKPLIETLAIGVGSSIAKAILKLWLKDNSIAIDTGTTIIDIVKTRTSDKLSQRKAQREFDEIGERVGQSLLPIFEMEGANLDENDKIAVAEAVADTLDTATSSILAQNNLNPTSLATYLLETHPAGLYHFNETEGSLYRRMIQESCTYIVDIASRLPTFTEQTFAEVLKREAQILEKVDKVLQEVQHLREQQDPVEEAARFELDYRRAVGRELDKLELFGANVRGASREQSLSVAYVRLSVEQNILGASKQARFESLIDRRGTINSPNDRDDTASTQTSNETTQRSIVVVDEALIHTQRLLIRGLAGSGKTTLLQWIAVNSAARKFKDTLRSWNALVPFYIRLRYHVNAEPSERPNLPRPEEFPFLISSAISDGMPKGWARDKLASGHAIVLVDGVDEVPEAQRKNVRIWLEDLIATYPQAYFIITSRPPAVEGTDWVDWLDAEGFQDAVLQPMNLRDIFEFIDHWHAAVAKRLLDEHEKAELPIFAQHLKDDLERNRAKRELATSPLLCAMLCALNRERQQQLPSDRIKLYEACCELLIEQRDKARSILLKDNPAAALEYSQKLLLLQDLAYWMTKNGKSEIELGQVHERFQRKINSMRNLPQYLYSNEGGTWVRKLFVERASLIREPIVGRIDFTHRTFQEFLTAKAVLDESDFGVLVQNAHNDQWREIVLLASGLMNKKSREELIDQLISRGDNEKDYRTKLHLLAAACHEASIEELGLNVKLALQERLSALIPPRDTEAAKELTTAGELAVPFLGKKDTYLPSTCAACVYALAIIANDEALKMLESYAHETNPEVIMQLWYAWSAFEGKKRTTYAQRILSYIDSDVFELMRQQNKYFPQPSIASFTSLEDIRYCTKLPGLYLRDCEQITDLTPLSTLTQLRSLDLSDMKQITDLTPLSTLTQLTSFNLTGIELTNSLISLSVLTQLKQLTTLALTDLEQISDLTPLSALTQLTHLFIGGCKQISDLTPLTALTKLTWLSIWGCGLISDLTPLSTLARLIGLSLVDSEYITDLTPLSTLFQLNEVTLGNLNRVNDLKPLSGLNKLSSILISVKDKDRMQVPINLTKYISYIDIVYGEMGPIGYTPIYVELK